MHCPLTNCLRLGTQALSLVLGVCLSVQAAPSDPLLPVWAEVRTEAARASSDPLGRPLPLAAHWQAGGIYTTGGFDPGWQISQVDAGHYILPSFNFPSIGDAYYNYAWYYDAPLNSAKSRNLPISINGTQWESILAAAPYNTLPYTRNPLVYNASTGQIVSGYLDPLADNSTWVECGLKWTSDNYTPAWRDLQSIYPNPPRVILLSNNEMSKCWPEDLGDGSPYADMSQRFVDRFGLGRTNEFKRMIFGNSWVSLYRAMQGSMRDGLNASGTWGGANTLLVGYGAFGPSHFRRWNGWSVYSYTIPNRIDPSPLMWDGGSPNFYIAYGMTDYTVYSPLIDNQNHVFMQQEAMQVNPNFWFEYSVWDGNTQGDFVPNILAAGQTYTPNRYKAAIQYAMWFSRPRALREYRSHTERRDCNGPPNTNYVVPNTPYTNTGYTNEQFFLALCDAVDKVHKSATLRSFWRKGTLVQNTAETHPWQDSTYVPVGYDDATINSQKGGRWFMLTASVNPARSTWTLSTEILVYSLALVQGTAPNRQWLVYAFSPRGNRSNVGITLPDYGQITLNVPSSGQFWLVSEATHSQSVVNDYLSVPAFNLRGTVVLADYIGDNGTIPVTVDLRGTTPRTETVTLDAQGNFTLANVAAGTYNIWIKGPHWLAATKSTVTVNANDLTDLGTMTLINGDCDGNNTIGNSDLPAVLTAMDAKSGGSNWNANADMDGDGEVTSNDLSIVLLNLGVSGNP